MHYAQLELFTTQAVLEKRFKIVYNEPNVTDNLKRKAFAASGSKK